MFKSFFIFFFFLKSLNAYTVMKPNYFNEYKEDVNNYAPSVIIGELDWVEVDKLDPLLPEVKLSKLVGQLYSSRKTKCTAWVHPVNGEVYTAHHCFDPNFVWARFVWHGEEYELTKWLCNKASDVCRTIDFNVVVDFGINLPMVVNDGLLIHRQNNKTVISYGTFKDHWMPDRYVHYMDSAPGSSGGMLVLAGGKELLPVAVHHSGSKERQENYASKLSVVGE